MFKRILTVLVFLLIGAGVAVVVLLSSESDEISDANVDRLIAEKVSVRWKKAPASSPGMSSK